MSAGQAASILHAVLAAEAAERLEQVQDAMRSATAPLGFNRFALFSAAAGPAVERILWIEGDWFADGAMDADTYLRRCPMTRHVLDADTPFFWSKIPTAAGERYRVHPAPRGRGVHGLQVPVFGRTGLVGAISLGGTRINSGATARLLLPVLAVAAFRAAERLLVPPVAADPALLSEREREILRWTASGRRHRDIADTLNLSGRTVESHLRRIRAKLGVHTTAHAVHVAMRSGVLEN